MATPSPYSLHYFNWKGVAEPIRLLLTYLDLEWTEENYDPNGAYADEQRQTALPLSWMCPVFEIGAEFKLSDPLAIGQFLGDTHKVAPSDPVDRARVLEIASGFMADLNGVFEMLRSIPGPVPKNWQEERQDRFERYLWHFLVPRIYMLDEWMGKKRDGAFIPGFLLGDEVCWADFYLYNAIRMIQTIPGAWIEGQYYVWLEQFLLKIEALPRVGEYIAARSTKDFFTIDASSLVRKPPFRHCDEERVVRTLPISDEYLTSDEDRRVVIPNWDWDEKEKRRQKRKDQRERDRAETEEAEIKAVEIAGGYESIRQQMANC